MNLHEECLLKYLLNPLGLFHTAELLKINNAIIREEINLKTGRGKNVKMRYTTAKI